MSGGPKAAFTLETGKVVTVDSFATKVRLRICISVYTVTVCPSIRHVTTRLLFIPSPIQLLRLHISPIRWPSHQLLCRWLHCFLFQLQRWSDGWGPYWPFFRHWRTGGYARYSHVCSKRCLLPTSNAMPKVWAVSTSKGLEQCWYGVNRGCL